MVFLAENRKAFLKEGLISTVSLEDPRKRKKRAAKAALKVKQGENQTNSPGMVKLSESR
jgi:hypothetical protein